METSKTTHTTRRAGRPGPGASIRADELLTLKELQRRLGWGEHAVRQARRAGLRLIRFGCAKYALGADVLRWFAQLAEAQDGERRRPAAGGKDAQ